MIRGILRIITESTIRVNKNRGFIESLPMLHRIIYRICCLIFHRLSDFFLKGMLHDWKIYWICDLTLTSFLSLSFREWSRPTPHVLYPFSEHPLWRRENVKKGDLWRLYHSYINVQYSISCIRLFVFLTTKVSLMVLWTFFKFDYVCNLLE